MFHITIIKIFILCVSTLAAPQQPEINDQFDVADATQKQIEETVVTEKVTEVTQVVNEVTKAPQIQTTVEPYDRISIRIYKFISEPISKIIRAPKVNKVLRNIGTCIVNGAMDIISHYLPAPFIPLIASAAGLVIPFEPIVMLKQKMPVTSYRRAFKTAMDTFLNTFDKYKVDDYDPYMTRRFNRRFMNDDVGDNKM